MITRSVIKEATNQETVVQVQNLVKEKLDSYKRVSEETHKKQEDVLDELSKTLGTLKNYIRVWRNGPFKDQETGKNLYALDMDKFLDVTDKEIYGTIYKWYLKCIVLVHKYLKLFLDLNIAYSEIFRYPGDKNDGSRLDEVKEQTRDWFAPLKEITDGRDESLSGISSGLNIRSENIFDNIDEVIKLLGRTKNQAKWQWSVFERNTENLYGQINSEDRPYRLVATLVFHEFADMRPYLVSVVFKNLQEVKLFLCSIGGNPICEASVLSGLTQDNIKDYFAFYLARMLPLQ